MPNRATLSSNKTSVQMTKDDSKISSELSPHVTMRLNPTVRDLDYLHLSDLLLALKSQIVTPPHLVLDLGCGASPYRLLFPNADYRRADLAGTPDVDFSLDDTDSIPSDYFDLVLSTQVLEHVRDPETYLRLALRSLKPGARLLLTTHGMFEEHACPEDYYRWTAQGLEHLMKVAGFAKVRSWKVTTQQRAAAYLILRYGGLLGLKRPTLLGFSAAVLNWSRRFFAPMLHRWLDRHAGECRVVDSTISGHELYIVVMVEGYKPIADS